MKKALLSIASCFVVLTAGAQQISLVKDFYPGMASSNPHRMTVFNDKLVCFAQDGFANGYEMHVMDSTGAFTMIDINPGPGDGGYNTWDYYKDLTICNGKLYFPGDDGTTGIELYSWDGINTPQLEADILPGTTTSELNFITAHGNMLYFVANKQLTGKELYSYNTSTSTLQLVADIIPGTTDAYPRLMTVFNNKIYFTARTIAEGFEPFVHDPVANTTTLVADIYSGNWPSAPGGYIVADGKLYFSAISNTHGTELYSIDSAGLVTRLTDINPGPDRSLTAAESGEKIIGYLNHKLYFEVRNSNNGQDLYSYDIATGTPAMVKKISTVSPVFPLQPQPFSFINYNNKLYFNATDSLFGLELWVCDGISAQRISDINPGAKHSGFADPAIYRGELYFTSGTDSLSGELYKFDDDTTTTTTTSIKKLAPQFSAKLSPNPCTNLANISIDLKQSAAVTIKLYDELARSVYTQPSQNYNAGKNEIQLPVAALAPGTYTCIVEGGRDKYITRFVKQ